jgi:hypothetical protein
LYYKRLIRSRIGIFKDILKEEVSINMRSLEPIDERMNSSSFNTVDDFKFLRSYKGFKDHLLDVKSSYIITKASILKNPPAQIDAEIILK